MKKPDNPYPKGPLIWSVMEGDWEDLTMEQIAEVMGSTYKAISSSITRIKKETGYRVPHAVNRGRKRREG